MNSNSELKKKWFIPDSESDAFGKNSILATHLSGAWNDLDIVRIDRIENDESGWEATYLVKN
jgi:hypothetical protein